MSLETAWNKRISIAVLAAQTLEKGLREKFRREISRPYKGKAFNSSLGSK